MTGDTLSEAALRDEGLVQPRMLLRRTPAGRKALVVLDAALDEVGFELLRSYVGLLEPVAREAARLRADREARREHEKAEPPWPSCSVCGDPAYEHGWVNSGPDGPRTWFCVGHWEIIRAHGVYFNKAGRAHINRRMR